MAIVTITITRNDVDILEAFVRHHAELVDAMIVVAHRCGDNSEELLQELVFEKLPLQIFSDHTPDGGVENTLQFGNQLSIHPIAMQLTQLMRQVARTQRYDWILPLDSDEFLKVQSEQSFPDVLKDLPREQSVAIRWKSYVPTAEDSEHEINPVRRISYRRAHETAMLPKVLIPAELALREDLLVSNGHHALLHRQDGSICPMTATDSLFLAHYPVRTEAQLRSKIMSGWLSVAASPTKGAREARHWQELYQRLKDPSPLTIDDIRRIAAGYSAEDEAQELVRDPLHTTNKPMRFTPRPVHPWTVLAENAEHLAGELASCSAGRMNREKISDPGEGA